MKSNFAAFGGGLLFAVGLVISGMVVPAKVVGFLDFTGAWDPSLGLVMAGAVAVHAVALRLVRRRPSPIFDAQFHLPTRKDIEPRLLLGAALFGIGWGLAGFCPGPGLVASASGAPNALVFVAAMTLGMLIEHRVARALAGRKQSQVTTETDHEHRDLLRPSIVHPHVRGFRSGDA